ncbi:MAG TPA: hypothetical protein VK816_01105 [Jatrophihabitantaceae bacterium]|nr:hypothetical protein [Jatrophihabitantaceae bacterium]
MHRRSIEDHRQTTVDYLESRRSGCSRGTSTSTIRTPSVPHLQPEANIACCRAVPDSGDLQETAAEEEDDPRIDGVAELPIDRESQPVAVGCG